MTQSASGLPPDHSAPPSAELTDDTRDLHRFGYQQKLRRSIGAYASFALGFSMITITTTIFTLFASPFQTIGGIGIWLWIPVMLGVLAITAVYAHLAARLPVTGYAYQWASRIVSREYGWFTGWTALLSVFVGTASIAVSMASVFAPEVWPEPTHPQIASFAAVAIVSAVVVNMVSIRAVTLFNNLGASAELVGTMGLTVLTAVGLFWFEDRQGVGVLFQVGSTTGTPIDLTAVGFAMLLPVYTLLDWEGCADLAEETRDPRRTAPTAMFRSVIVSAVCAFFVYAVFAIAIPGDLAATVNRTDNALIAVFETHFGPRLGLVMKAVALVSMASALLANVTVATRLCFSLARDHMLPGSRLLARVDRHTKTPVYCIVLVGAFALLVNLLSEGIVKRVVAIVAVTYYGTYLLTMAGVLIGKRRGTIPSAPARYFDLGRWLEPLAVIGIGWSLVIIAFMTLPEANHIAGEYTVYFELAGALWFLVHLRKKLRRGEAGPPVAPILATEQDERRAAGAG